MVIILTHVQAKSGDIAWSCPLQGMLRYSPIVHLSMPLRLGNFQPQRGSWSTTFAEPTRIVDSSFFQGRTKTRRRSDSRVDSSSIHATCSD